MNVWLPGVPEASKSSLDFKAFGSPQIHLSEAELPAFGSVFEIAFVVERLRKGPIWREGINQYGLGRVVQGFEQEL